MNCYIRYGIDVCIQIQYIEVVVLLDREVLEFETKYHRQSYPRKVFDSRYSIIRCLTLDDVSSKAKHDALKHTVVSLSENE